MRTRLGVLVFIVGVALTGAVIEAHHSSSLYEPTKQLTLKGTVTQWVWTNPHCFLKFDATDDTGAVQHWAIETQNPTDMSSKGFSRTSFKLNDVVTVTFRPARNGQPVGIIVKAVLPNGQVLDSSNILSQ
jgi:hypothetical protein